MTQLALLPSLQSVNRPAIRHFGSKWRASKRIIAQFAPHLTYTEVFCGSASTFFQKLYTEREVLNDLNPGSINFFRVLQSFPGELIKALQETPENRDEFYGCFETHSDALEWARRYACLGWGGFAGAGGRWSGGCSNASLQRLSNIDWSFLWNCSDRLQNTIIQHGDALAALRQYDGPTTLHYVDPPYPAQSRKGQDKHSQSQTPRRQYAFEMLEDSLHQQLFDVLCSLRGKVVLSGRQCPLYAELFEDWRRVDIPVRDGDRSAAIESIWMNF